jgi:transcriptional regulator with GAF, ATPase, and Fis domain
VNSPDQTKAHSGILAAFYQIIEANALEQSVKLNKITKTLANIIGDGATIILLDKGGMHLVCVASAHRDRQLDDDFKVYLSNMRIPVATSFSISAQVVRNGMPILANVQPQEMVNQTDEALKPMVARLNVHSFAVVPIKLQNSNIGTIALMRSSAGNNYSTRDLKMLEEIATILAPKINVSI